MKDAHSHITNQRKEQQERLEVASAPAAPGSVAPTLSGSIYKGPDKPKMLEGKMTMLGLGITLIGMIAGQFGLTLPDTESKDFLHWLGANWDTLSQGIGILMAGWGRFRIKQPKSPA